MTYVPPFNHFRRKLRMSAANGPQRVQMEYDDLLDYIKLLLRSVAVDEAWYLARNPDVAQAIAKGNYRSAKHHFVEDGYFEGRMPYEFKVDEVWYAGHYPDVAAGLKEGVFDSARQHFLSHGYMEGRLPCAEY